MKKQISATAHQRRAFISKLLSGAALFGLGSMVAPLSAKANDIPLPEDGVSDADAWFNKVKGKHRIVYDVPAPHEMMPFAWPRVFMLTNEKTGTASKDQGIVVVLRHHAIPFAMNSGVWEKYKFGEMIKFDDPKTKAPAVRNPFWEPQPGDFKVPGVGNVEIGINELQRDGVLFCVCDMAMTVISASIAQASGAKAEDVKKDFTDGLLPGIQPVPSGVWAVGRAQEHGCAYCFVG